MRALKFFGQMLLMFGVAFGLIYIGYIVGQRDGKYSKGQWYQKTDTIQHWYFKPDKP